MCRLLKMKFKHIIGTIFLILAYMSVINKTVILYYLPNPELNIIFHDFRQNAIIFEIIFTLMVFSTIPLFYFIRSESRKKLKKVPILTIFLLSAFYPIFAFVNNYFTGNILISTIFLVSGILFTLIVFKLEYY